MSTTMPAAAQPARPGRVGSTVLLVLGSLAALVALALVAGGITLVWADTTQRDDDGFFVSRGERLSTSAYALTHEGIHISRTPDWVVERLGTVRVRVTADPGRELFVGVADEAYAGRYLRGVGHGEVVLNDYDSPFRSETLPVAGGAPRIPPGEAGFWEASRSGPGTQTLTWPVAAGDWAFVVMNADGSRAVAADVELGIRVDWLLELALALIAVATLFALGAAAMVVAGVRRSPAEGTALPPAAAPLAAAPAEAVYPVALEARLDEPLSRWLWLVKWFLAIPHFVVLAFLWAAFVVLTVVAFFAILFTGRYPRSIFSFNLGVLRWTWRVSFYAVSGIGTDRYPPFSLDAEPDYPATLDIAYPERLSRGLVLVKSWLLAIPHLIVVGIFTGSATRAFTDWTVEFPGLIAVLTLVAAAVLLFRGRYPRDLFDLIVGCSRWVYRVLAYVALMRDEYPPFRLGR